MQNVSNGQTWANYAPPPLPPPASGYLAQPDSGSGVSADTMELGREATGGALPGPSSAWLTRLKDPHSVGRAGYELAQRPTSEVLAVFKEALSDYSPNNAPVHRMLITI